MCGIAGIVDLQAKRTPSRALLERMNELQIHRGPDEFGFHVEPGVGLAHRRLAIIDLAAGQQPLFNEDGSVVITYNGEIYNFAEIHDDLAARGHVFRTHCDTEVVVHAWEEWGPACVERFRGMFVFGIWDRRAGRFFLARDRLGIKPLFYAPLRDGTLVFASELKALLVHPDVPREIDKEAIEEYFAYGYIPEPRTFFVGIRKLPPAHRIVFQHGAPAPSPEPYWDVHFREDADRDTAPEAAVQAELLERLREAIRVRLVSEVPLGAFLSGGVDSSAVVAMMAGLQSDPVHTCTISFGERRFDEAEYANEVATRYHTDHHAERVSSDLFDLVDRLASFYDEPYADSSAMPTYRLCGLARQRVTVALSGDGGDENVAGYRRYRWHMLEEQVRGIVPGVLRRPLFGLAASLYPKADWAPRWLRAKSTLEGIARDSVEAYHHTVSLAREATRDRLFHPDLTRALGGYRAIEVMRRHAARGPRRDPLAQIQYLDLKTYLPGDILTKVDRASMAHSLEVRVPFLDHPLVEWLATIPSGLKLRDGEGKYVLKRALEPHLSQDLLYRPKMGFGVPISLWFRGPLRERLEAGVLSPEFGARGLFDTECVARLVREHQAGARDNGSVLWSLLMFDASLRHLDGLRPSTPAWDAAGSVATRAEAGAS